MNHSLNTAPIDYDDRIILWARNHQHAVEIDRQLTRIAVEVGADLPPTLSAPTAAGDQRRLRGIPAIGRGVAGAITGTRPGGNLR